MIKTALKHWLYEHCINIIFNGILINFIGNPRGSIHLKQGTKYNLIEISRDREFNEIYYNVRVNLIDKLENDTASLIRFTYSHGKLWYGALKLDRKVGNEGEEYLYNGYCCDEDIIRVE